MFAGFHLEDRWRVIYANRTRPIGMANDGTRAVVDLVELEAEVLVALQKVKIETKTIQPSGGRPSYNNWNCSGCGKRHHRGTVYGGNRCKNCATTTTRKIDTKAAQAAISKAIRKAGPGQVSTDLVAAYTEAGLAEPFAVAMARDESNSDSILDLWEADWWKQYEVTDPLVGAVLDGVLPENDAKWLNTVRSDHPDLVMECIQQTLTVEWSRALLDAGFNGHIDAVKAALKGGEPRLVARIQRLQVDVDHLPMKRTGTPRTQKSSKKDVKRQRLSGHAKVTHQSMEAVLQASGSRTEQTPHPLGGHGEADLQGSPGQNLARLRPQIPRDGEAIVEEGVILTHSRPRMPTFSSGRAFTVISEEMEHERLPGCDQVGPLHV